MLNWSRSKPQYNESVFGTNFRQECEALAKLLSDEKGFYVNGKTTSDGKFTYKAKIVDKKDKSGKVVFVERIPLTGDPIIDSLPGKNSEEEIAHKNSVRITDNVVVDRDAERQSRIDKAHQENLVAQQNINETLIAILGELRRIADAQEAKHEI